MNQRQQLANIPSKEQFKSIQLLHIALMIGMILVFVALWFQATPTININPMEGTFALILPFVMVAAIGAGTFLYNKQKNTTSPDATLAQKIADFRKISLLRWSLIEGASLASVVIFYFIETNISLLFAFTLGLFAFAVFRPTVDEFATDFGLNQQERKQLQ